MAQIFTPIKRNPGLGWQKYTYNDSRLAHRQSILLDRMRESQSNVVHKVSLTYAEERSFYRFLHNDHVTHSEMIEHIFSPTIPKLSQRDLLVIGDSSEFSLHRSCDRIKDLEKVGFLSDNKTRGFLSHLNMVLDADTGNGLGLSDLQLWTRPKSKVSKLEKDRYLAARTWSEKESFRWWQGIQHSQNLLSAAKSVMYVFDSEADFAQLWASCIDQPFDVLIRVQNRNRQCVGTSLDLFSWMDDLPSTHSYELEVSPLNRHNYSKNQTQVRQKRLAQMNLRYGTTSLMLNSEEGKKVADLYAVDVRESTETVPEGEKPIHWRLLTTRAVESVEDAMKIVQYYLWRWLIEQLFRTLKRKGFAAEETELTTFDAILKQTILSFQAAFQVMQLVMSRDQKEGQPIEDIFSPEEQACLETLNLKMEGNTAKQQNPYPRQQLAWASWVIARLSGWKGYQSQHPPGPIRMKRGLAKFQTYFDAWNLFRPN